MSITRALRTRRLMRIFQGGKRCLMDGGQELVKCHVLQEIEADCLCHSTGFAFLSYSGQVTYQWISHII